MVDSWLMVGGSCRQYMCHDPSIYMQPSRIYFSGLLNGIVHYQGLIDYKPLPLSVTATSLVFLQPQCVLFVGKGNLIPRLSQVMEGSIEHLGIKAYLVTMT